jgi:hypothetical protein
MSVSFESKNFKKLAPLYSLWVAPNNIPISFPHIYNFRGSFNKKERRFLSLFYAHIEQGNFLSL